MRLEEVMAPKTHKGSNLLTRASSFPRAIRHDLDGCAEIVVTDAVGNPAKVFEGAEMRIQETFLGLRGKRHRERPAGVAQTHQEELDFLAVSIDDSDGLAPIDLGILARIKFQWEKHLWPLVFPSAFGDVVAYARFTAPVSLGLDDFKDAMRGVALFAGYLFILLEQRLNTRLIGAKDGRRSRPRQLVGLGRCIGNGFFNGLTAVACFSGDLANAFLLQIVGSSNVLFVAFVQHRQLSSCELHDPTSSGAKGEKEFSPATLILP